MLNALSRRRICRPPSLLGARYKARFLSLNLTEKIVQKYAVGLPEGKQVRSGDYVSIRPAHCMSHDNSWPIATKFLALGADKVYDNRQVVNTLDHDVQNKSETNLRKYRNIENFAHKHGIDFYPAGSGIGHQIMVEQGYAFPLSLVVASDSHSNMYGGIGCLGTPVVRTDGAAIWATGQTWWQIPPVAKVELRGRLQPGVSGKDVIVALCGLFNNDEVLNHAIEFVGEAIPHIPIEDRLTIANMTTEWGALTGLFTVDERLINWYKSRISVLPQPHPRINEQRVKQLIEQSQHIKADSDANYAKHLVLDLDSLSPRASGPNSVKIFNEVDTLETKNIPINKAYLVSCTNSRLSDIKSAARVVRGRKVAPNVEFYVAGASKQVQADAEKSGDWQALIDAGAKPLPAGCGPCIGLGTGLLEPGEVGISATNRNFKGRMGSRDALAYLASPAVVAASAIAGRISRVETVTGEPKQPTKELVGFVVEEPKEREDESSPKPTEAKSSAGDILPGFPERISGELIFCDADNINTDGIYPGKYTYQDDVPREKMAEVCMENYDGDFGKISKPGDVIISGFNFGTGSSREQAATAILARQIPLVVAGSFGNIFFRNSINNALLTLELPKLVSLLRQKYASDPNRLPTRRTGWFIEWDVAKSVVKTYDASPESPQAKVIHEQSVGELGRNLQEIIVEGGLEGWVKAQMQKKD